MMNNKGTVLYFIAVLLMAMLACNQTLSVASPMVPPQISVQITKDYCPSMEVQSGMQIAWINLDAADRILIIDRMDEHGEIVDSAGTHLLEAGDSYSVFLDKPGHYKYYCSRDHSAFGMITVLQ